MYTSLSLTHVKGFMSGGKQNGKTRAILVFRAISENRSALGMSRSVQGKVIARCNLVYQT